MKRIARTLAWLLVPLVAVAGCAGGKQTGILSRWMGGGASSLGASSASSESDRILAEYKKHNSSQGSWSQSVSNAFTTMGKALTPESSRVAANDAISLSTTPLHVPTDVYLNAASLLESKGNMDSAQAQYQTALKQDPRNVTALIAYARYLDRRNLAPVAEQTYLQALSVNPGNPTAHNDIGLFYASRQRLPEAASHLQQAVELNPDRALYRNNLAKVLVQQERVDLARAQLIAVLPPEVAEYNLGVLLSEANRPAEAAACLETALRIKPEFADAAHMLASIGSPPAGPATGPYLAPAPAAASIAQQAQTYLADGSSGAPPSPGAAGAAAGPFVDAFSPATVGDEFNIYSGTATASPPQTLTAPDVNWR